MFSPALPAPLPVQERGRWYVPVPWTRAEDFRTRLSRRGYPATLCLDPGVRQARLELWPGVTPEPVAALVQDFLTVRPGVRVAVKR